jgi:hypothetical protein
MAKTKAKKRQAPNFDAPIKEPIHMREMPRRIAHLMERYNDADVTDEQREEIELELLELEESFEHKCESIATYHLNALAMADPVDLEIKRLQALKAQRIAIADSSKDFLKRIIYEHTNGKPLETNLFKFSFRASEGLIITDPKKIPAKYQFEETIVKTDNAAIKKDLQAGKAVKGAILDKRQNLQIK